MKSVSNEPPIPGCLFILLLILGPLGWVLMPIFLLACLLPPERK